MTKAVLTYDDLPMFVDDERLAQVFMPKANVGEWRQIVALLEGRGFPKIDALLGGRYKPAVKDFFDREYKIASPTLQAKDGPENWEMTPLPKSRLRPV